MGHAARKSFIALEKLRRGLAHAAGLASANADIMGPNWHKGPDQPLSPRSFSTGAHRTCGRIWRPTVLADGHGAGIFSFRIFAKAGALKHQPSPSGLSYPSCVREASWSACAPAPLWL